MVEVNDLGAIGVSIEPPVEGETYRFLQFIYKNYKGEVAERVVIPVGHWYGSTEWHPKKQFLLKAYDVRKAAYRDFALNDVLFWGSTVEWEKSKNENA
jgi:hypothetical protein